MQVVAGVEPLDGDVRRERAEPLPDLLALHPALGAEEQHRAAHGGDSLYGEAGLGALVDLRKPEGVARVWLSAEPAVPDWLVANRDALSGKVSRIPTRDEMQPMVNEQLIVELYSK